MSSAIFSNLDQYEILLSGNGLKHGNHCEEKNVTVQLVIRVIVVGRKITLQTSSEVAWSVYLMFTFYRISPNKSALPNSSSPS